MFDVLQTKLGGVFEKLKGRGSLNASDVETAMGEIRTALLEADVALPVVKTFISDVKARAVGADLIKSVSPGQQVVKIVHDTMVAIFDGAGENKDLNLRGEPPVAIMMVGLQGSGKTTSSAKVAKLLSDKQNKKVLMASLDVNRPAAQQQLAVLGEQISVETLPIIAGESPKNITKRAMTAGKLGGYDIVILDTAGRLSIDEQLMAEVSEVKKIAKPQEILLVTDAMTGQDSVNTAQNFNEKLALTGIVLTRVDGDSRGGVALSMRAVTGCPIKFMGTGEKTADIELFDAERVAGRILGMGDVVALVEKAQEVTDEESTKKTMKRMQSGEFDLNDLKTQLQQMNKMGGLSGIMGMLPGMKGMKDKMESAGINEAMIKRQIAVIDSMTKAEKKNPKILHASRRKRIANGSGTLVQDVNKLIKQFQSMEKVMKQMRKMGGKMPDMGALGNSLGGNNPLGGGNPFGGGGFRG